MENRKIDLPLTDIAKFSVAINPNRSSKLAKHPKKMLTKFAAAALALTASTISSHSLAASSDNTQLWQNKKTR